MATGALQQGLEEAPPSRARRAVALGLILVSSFMTVLDFSIVNVALPSIQRQLGFSSTSVQWVVTAYAITFGGLLILGGRMADLFGRRRMLIAGLVLFSVASLTGGVAASPALLVAARAFQGVGAAIIAPASISLLTTTYREGPERNRALGLYGATASVGFVAGLVLGGILVDLASWRAVFFVNVPVGVLSVVLALVILPKLADRTRRVRLDPLGALLVTAGITALVYAASEGPVSGWGSPRVLAPIAAAALLGTLFVIAERHHPQPLVRLGILRNQQLRWANVVTMLLGFWSGGQVLVMSYYLQSVRHYSPLLTGLALAPQGLIGFATGLRGAALTRRFGVNRLLVLTTLSSTVGLALLVDLPNRGGYGIILLAIAFVGFGNAGTGFATTVAASSGVVDGEQGLAGGLLITNRQIGAAVGSAILLVLAEGRVVATSSSAGSHHAMLAATAVAAVGVLVSYAGLRRVSARAARLATPPRARAS
jgi:EmrB/QacA subfamily drug resistance transporter